MIRFNIALAALLTVLAGARAQGQTVPNRGTPLSPAPEMPLPQGIEVEFTADGTDIIARIIDLVALAKKEVMVSQYAITDIRVLQALSAAAQRGVLVAVLLDRSPNIKNYDAPRYLRAQSIPVIHAERGVNGRGWHNQRYVVIDREAVILSSSDLTNSARHNSENLIVIRQPAVAVKYFNNWLSDAAKGDTLP